MLRAGLRLSGPLIRPTMVWGEIGLAVIGEANGLSALPPPPPLEDC